MWLLFSIQIITDWLVESPLSGLFVLSAFPLIFCAHTYVVATGVVLDSWRSIPVPRHEISKTAKNLAFSSMDSGHESWFLVLEVITKLKKMYFLLKS